MMHFLLHFRQSTLSISFLRHNQFTKSQNRKQVISWALIRLKLENSAFLESIKVIVGLLVLRLREFFPPLFDPSTYLFLFGIICYMYDAKAVDPTPSSPVSLSKASPVNPSPPGMERFYLFIFNISLCCSQMLLVLLL